MRIVISITAQDIRAGERHSCRRCPIALAAARVLPDYRVLCHDTDLFLKDRHDPTSLLHVIGLPEAARRFIRDFDGESDVMPLSFSIEVPDGAK